MPVDIKNNPARAEEVIESSRKQFAIEFVEKKESSYMAVKTPNRTKHKSKNKGSASLP